jgi:hypothetical protein
MFVAKLELHRVRCRSASDATLVATEAGQKRAVSLRFGQKFQALPRDLSLIVR